MRSSLSKSFTFLQPHAFLKLELLHLSFRALIQRFVETLHYVYFLILLSEQVVLFFSYQVLQNVRNQLDLHLYAVISLLLLQSLYVKFNIKHYILLLLFYKTQKLPSLYKGTELTRVATLVESITAFLSSRNNGSSPGMLTNPKDVPHSIPGWIHKLFLSISTNHRLSIRNNICYYFLSTRLFYKIVTINLL